MLHTINLKEVTPQCYRKRALAFVYNSSCVADTKLLLTYQEELGLFSFNSACCLYYATLLHDLACKW